MCLQIVRTLGKTTASLKTYFSVNYSTTNKVRRKLPDYSQKEKIQLKITIRIALHIVSYKDNTYIWKHLKALEKILFDLQRLNGPVL